MNKIVNPYQINSLSELSELSALTPGYHVYLSEHEKSLSDQNSEQWEYYINEYRFRDKWKLQPNTKKIGFFGCSCTFGVGVKSHYTFAKIIENRYRENNVESINLGLPGSGLQRIAKLVMASNKLLNFDYAVITAPSYRRFLLLNDNNNMIDIVPGFVSKEFKFFYSSLTDQNLEMLFMDYVHWINAELKNCKKVIWSSWCVDTQDILKSIVDKSSLIPYYHFFDKGRDNHPGVKSNSLHAKNIINSLGKLD